MTPDRLESLESVVAGYLTRLDLLRAERSDMARMLAALRRLDDEFAGRDRLDFRARLDRLATDLEAITERR